VNRLDRALGILLLLRSSKEVSAMELARRFEVSPRTIYRDMETLSALGVPIYAERGRAGGFRLLEGYFLPPIMFTQDEAMALVVGLTFLQSLRSKPFAADLDTAEKKLVAAVSDQLRESLIEAQQRIGFEMPRSDIFHPEPSSPNPSRGAETSATEQAKLARENQAVQIFLRSVFSRKAVALDYRSPYRGETEYLLIDPLGVFWDREYWYLVGKEGKYPQDIRLCRADRVIGIHPQSQATAAPTAFDIREHLGRSWLRRAMQRWAANAPVRIRLTHQQAERLQQDWYFRHAHFEPLSETDDLMTFGEGDQAVVLELLRWLGPGAELLEPRAWRGLLKEHLLEMLTSYRDDESGKASYR
jgi:predicted DNA-binding transcriptional regulator YafY